MTGDRSSLVQDSSVNFSFLSVRKVSLPSVVVDSIIVASIILGVCNLKIFNFFMFKKICFMLNNKACHCSLDGISNLFYLVSF